MSARKGGKSGGLPPLASKREPAPVEVEDEGTDPEARFAAAEETEPAAPAALAKAAVEASADGVQFTPEGKFTPEGTFG